jgi:hypothetical protein
VINIYCTHLHFQLKLHLLSLSFYPIYYFIENLKIPANINLNCEYTIFNVSFYSAKIELFKLKEVIECAIALERNESIIDKAVLDSNEIPNKESSRLFVNCKHKLVDLLIVYKHHHIYCGVCIIF